MRKQRKAKERQGIDLFRSEGGHYWDIVLGPSDYEPSPFASDAERKATWFANYDRLMRGHASLGHRPAGWWAYSCPRIPPDTCSRLDMLWRLPEKDRLPGEREHIERIWLGIIDECRARNPTDTFKAKAEALKAEVPPWVWAEVVEGSCDE